MQCHLVFGTVNNDTSIWPIISVVERLVAVADSNVGFKTVCDASFFNTEFQALLLGTSDQGEYVVYVPPICVLHMVLGEISSILSNLGE